MALNSNLEDVAVLLPKERSHFFPSLLAAMVIELLVVLAGVYIAHRPQPVLQPPRVTFIHVVTAPKPVPPPPKPVPPPPKPVPPPPKPVPPPPRPMPRPLPKVQPKPVVRHAIAKPKPIAQQAPPPPSPPRQVPIPEAVKENAMEVYAGVVHDAVQTNLQVPDTVAMMHLSGVTKIALSVAPNGNLLSATVIKSSGISLIDKAALATVRATHFPPFSGKMPKHPITIEISVSMKSQ